MPTDRDHSLSSAPGALAGIRVLDLSHNAPGPFATMVLGDLGADVIQVLHPDAAKGEPAFLAPLHADSLIAARHKPFDAVMRNKRSIGIDLKTPEGLALVKRLADRADVLVEEMRPGKAAKLGIGYEDLARTNPRLVYCSITGFGQTGPYRGRAGHDINYIALAGAIDLLRQGEGEPVVPQNILADYAGGGLIAVVGILAALMARERIGRGQYVDVGMTDGVLYLLADLLSAWLGGGSHPDLWRGNFGGETPSFRCYRCADGKYLAIGALERRFAERLCAELGRPDLIALLADRACWPQARAGLAEIFAGRPRDAWLALFDEADVCVSPVLGLGELADHPQIRAREMIVEQAGVTQVGLAPKLSATPGSIRRPPAAPCGHSGEILGELGLDAAEIGALRARGVIG